MTVGTIEGNHCIVYKENKPNDMGSSIKDNIMKSATMCMDLGNYDASDDVSYMYFFYI